MKSSGVITVNLLLDSENSHPIQEPTSFQTIFLRSGQNASTAFMGKLRRLSHL